MLNHSIGQVAAVAILSQEAFFFLKKGHFLGRAVDGLLMFAGGYPLVN